MCKSDYTEKSWVKKEKRDEYLRFFSEKSAVINDCHSTENDKSLLIVNDKSNLFTLFLFQSFLLHSIIIHYLSDNLHLINLSFFLNQCFWFERNKKWRMNIIQLLSWIFNKKIFIEDFCQKTFNDDFLN